MSRKTCDIRVSSLTGLYYIGVGATRLRPEYRRYRNAVAAAHRLGFEVANDDPMPEFIRNGKRTKIVTNLLSGKLVRIPVNTPLCCDPSSETYWSS